MLPWNVANSSKMFVWTFLYSRAKGAWETGGELSHKNGDQSVSSFSCWCLLFFMWHYCQLFIGYFPTQLGGGNKSKISFGAEISKFYLETNPKFHLRTACSFQAFLQNFPESCSGCLGVMIDTLVNLFFKNQYLTVYFQFYWATYCRFHVCALVLNQHTSKMSHQTARTDQMMKSVYFLSFLGSDIY